jgi:hypothetical protein
MGTVAMGAGGSYRFEGNLISQTAYCLYCDKCGSFKIGRRITLKMLIWIAAAGLIATVFWYSGRNGALPGAWFACFGSLVLFLSIIGVFNLRYRCKRCGNIHINTDMNNSLSYREYDRSILDVPYDVTVKFYSDNY